MGFWLRSVALLIDLIVVIICLIVCVIFLGLSNRGASILALVIWLAFSTLDIFLAASVGKLILGLRIAKSDATPADRWTLQLRWSTVQLPAISMLLYLTTHSPGFYQLEGYSSLVVIVGCLGAANDWKQAWHDEWAHTAVFRRTKTHIRTNEADRLRATSPF